MVSLSTRLKRWTGAADPRDVPTYSIPEAAHYLSIPASTLRSWVKGRSYPTSKGSKRSHPIIKLPDRRFALLSFYNLVEAHVLSALRRDHQIALPHIRRAVSYVSKQLGCPRPLIEREFETDGVALFVRRLDSLVDVTAEGQQVMREVVEAHLRRVERDEEGLVRRVFPFTRSRTLEAPRLVAIDSRVAFGRPVLAGTRIPTLTIAERYKAGDSIDALSVDYGLSREAVEEALRCELQVKAA